MQQYAIKDVKGVQINEGTIHERCIKLFASSDPRAKIQRPYGCGMTIMEPGQVHEEHAHPDSEEMILVVQGTGTARIGGKEITIAPMEVIGIDKGEPHTFANTGDTHLCMYWVYTPPGPETKFIVD